MGETPELTEADAKLADIEVARITAATARLKPEWLGKPDAGFMAIDYARFKPQGFYADEPRLAAFFRATAWLQSIPMRVGNDAELATAMLLGKACLLGGEYHLQDDVFQRYQHLLGECDDLPLEDAMYLGTDLAAAREKLRDELPPKINDQDRMPAPEGEPLPLTFRVLPGYLLAEAPMLQRTGASRVLPSGLDVAAALGSPVARKQLSEPLLAEADKLDLTDPSLHTAYLRLLKHLNHADADAPELFRSEVWNIKSCNTQLAGWAQMRHTWALQAKRTVYARMATHQHPGFVEPVPEFFSALAELCSDVHLSMRRARAFGPDVVEYARLLREYARLGEEKNFGYTPENDPKDLTPAEWYDLARAEEVAYWLGMVPYSFLAWEEKEEVQIDFIKKLREVADQLVDGTYPHALRVRDVATNFGENFDAQWRDLEVLARRCETLAHKQLRELDFNDSDREFMKEFGKRLAGVMFYQGNSWLFPRDDAPRVSEIAWSAEHDERLLVGIARPRALYVLYPWKGELILCEGAVLPYYEFRGREPMTDAEWIASLDGEKRPAIPEWLKPIVHDGRLPKPDMKR